MRAAETTQDLLMRLSRRYGGRGSTVLLQEVGDGAGFGNRGWSDALAMETWPSRGLEVTGFEVKASRQDWLRELDKPDKNRGWQDCCHFWYIVAPKDVVKAEELPASWGLMIPKGSDQLRISSRAQLVAQPTPVSYELLAAVFRAARNAGDQYRQRIVEEVSQDIAAQFQLRIDRAEESAEKAEVRERESSSLYHQLRSELIGRWGSHEEALIVARAVAQLDSDKDQLKLELAQKKDRLGAARDKVIRAIQILEGEDASEGATP